MIECFDCVVNRHNNAVLAGVSKMNIVVELLLLSARPTYEYVQHLIEI